MWLIQVFDILIKEFYLIVVIYELSQVLHCFLIMFPVRFVVKLPSECLLELITHPRESDYRVEHSKFFV